MSLNNLNEKKYGKHFVITFAYNLNFSLHVVVKKIYLNK